jgi:hypothetical protein
MPYPTAAPRPRQSRTHNLAGLYFALFRSGPYPQPNRTDQQCPLEWLAWRLDHKTVIITGAGRGLGRAIAVELSGLGANILCASGSTDQLAATARLIKARGGTVAAHAGAFRAIGAVWEVGPDTWSHIESRAEDIQARDTFQLRFLTNF